MRHYSLFVTGNYLADTGKDATVGVSARTNELRKQGVRLEKLISDENRATFSVLKRREEKLVTDGGSRMIMASISSAKPFYTSLSNLFRLEEVGR